MTGNLSTHRAERIVPQAFQDRWLAAGFAGQRWDSRDGFRARHDAAESVFTQRALLYIEQQLYTTLTPPLKARLFVPTSVRASAGAEAYVWRRLTRNGVARLVTGSGLDLPRATFFTDEISTRFYPVGVKIVYSYFELLAVGMALENNAPVDLVGESLKAAMVAVEKKLDYIAAFGSASVGSYAAEIEADVGLTGLLNSASATSYTVATGASGSKTWANKTADEVLADLNGIVGGQVASTYEVHRPDTVIVPIAAFEQQLQRRMSDVSGETILSFFQRTRREAGHSIEIVPWMYASGAGAAGADRMVAYKRDPMLAEHVLAMDASPLEPSRHGLETTQPVVAKTAGVIIRNPLSVSYGDGI